MLENAKISPLSDAVGAEVSGLDLRRLNQDSFDALRDTFGRYSVLCFRDQALSPEDHIAFAKRWGTIVINRFFRPDETFPEIAQVSKEPHQKTNIGSQWHTDHSYDQIPAMGSILVARELPESGGDTEFAGMGAAFDALSDGLKQTLRSLKAWHSSRHSFGYVSNVDRVDSEGRLSNPDQAVQDALHPVVIRHPISGRECLYVNPEFTTRFDGWSEAESAPLLKFLYDHAGRREFTCRVQWKAGTVTMWDNRATLHRAYNDYHGHRRLMHRITIAGDALS